MSNFAEYFSSVEVPKEPSAPLEVEPEGDVVSPVEIYRTSSAEDLLTEIPVSLEVFIRDKKYLGETTFAPSDIQADAIKHIERIYYPSLYPKLAQYDPYWSSDIRLTNYHALQWGKGSGKDSICRMAFLRISYLFMCLKNPQRYYGIPDDDNVHMLNVATSSDQAQRAFFGPLKKNVQRGWFKDKAHSTKYDITFDKGLIGISGHSETESQEGLNLLLGICDEIDGFKTKAHLARSIGASAQDSTRSAESIINMMKSSSVTRFPGVFKQVYISYPRHLGSMIQQKSAQGRKDNEENGAASKWFVSGPYATWEVKPSAKKSHYDEEYKEDFHEADGKYGCNPTFAQDPYFKNKIAVEACFRHEETPSVDVSYVYDGMAWRPQYEFSEDFYPIQGAQYAMHADLAISGDRAGIAMAHVVRNEAVEKDIFAEGGELIRVTDMLPYVKADFVINYTADVSGVPPREIQIRWARDLWAELKLRGFNVRQFSYDGYQSTESRQELEKMGVASPVISTDRSEDPWKTLKDLTSGGRASIPYSEILYQEILSLTKRSNGRVDHTSQGCFVGSTRVPLLDGSFPEIKDLVGREEWVWSAKPDGTLVPGKARGRVTKYTRDLVDVILDSGYVARCTPDHLWMLRDGSYKPAKDLAPSVDRLMPINWTWPVNGGYISVSDKCGRRSLAHRLVAEYEAGRLSASNEVTHHVNELKTDNRPENLQLLDSQEHRLIDTVRTVGDKASNFNEAARMLGCGRNVVVSRVKRAGFSNWEEFSRSCDLNHKVRAVLSVHLEDPVPVYDLEVDKWHNFALSGGVFVHNSKDMADALACSITGAIMLGGQEAPNGARAYYAKPEFIIDTTHAPELEFDSRDVINMEGGQFAFHSTIQGDGWSDGMGSSWF